MTRRLLAIVMALGVAALAQSCAGPGSVRTRVDVGFGYYGGWGYRGPLYGPGFGRPIGPPRPPPMRPPPGPRPPPTQLPSMPRPMPR